MQCYRSIKQEKWVMSQDGSLMNDSKFLKAVDEFYLFVDKEVPTVCFLGTPSLASSSVMVTGNMQLYNCVKNVET